MVSSVGVANKGLAHTLQHSLSTLTLEHVCAQRLTYNKSCPPPSALRVRVCRYGGMPYHSYRLQEVQRLILDGMRLQQPQGTPDEVYSVMQR